MGRLDGKTAIVTGAARGQGEKEARLFVAEGANVVLCDVRDEVGEAIAHDLGASAFYTHLDVSDEDQWTAAVQSAHSRFGDVHVLVNNAGTIRPGTIVGGSIDDYHHMVAVNQTGVYLGMRACAGVLRSAGGGSIVNISSTGGFTGTPGAAAYGATKWAVRGLTKTAALEFARHGIRVNSVHPGLIATDMLTELGVPDHGARRAREETPTGRVGTPEEVARLVLFLASDESSYCTGSEFVVDGGLLTFAGTPRRS